MQYFLYILTNKYNTVFYVGVTNNLERRMYEHQNKLIAGFSQKYNINKLIYIETFLNIDEAIAAEKKVKRWKRKWKLNMIKALNPYLIDLSLAKIPQQVRDDTKLHGVTISMRDDTDL